MRNAWRRPMPPAGRSKSAKQTPAQAVACTSEAAPPRIAVAALLQLAQWCQERRTAQQGGTSCLTTPGSVCPPVSNGDHAAVSDATLGTARTGPTTDPVPAPLPADPDKNHL